MNGQIFIIKSVLSGTFYRRPSPDEPVYVNEGETVKPGQVVCIVESMKIFNEVRVERKGIIRKILIEDEDSVLIHQPMFEVEVI